LNQPRMLIVGGPNGAGKTTVALAYADELHLPYVGADAIAASLNPTDPARAQVAASREFIGTLAELQRFIAASQDHGYLVDIAFLFVDSADMCVARVAERVRKGGHSVPELDIRRRFNRAVRKFWTIYRLLADNWVLLYNGMTTLQDVAVGSKDHLIIRDPALFSAFKTTIDYKP
jgi:predicted ABC-type ATPase